MNIFNAGHSWYPVRWFVVLIGILTMGMTAVDYTGYRFLGANNSPQPRGYYGSHYYHK